MALKTVLDRVTVKAVIQWLDTFKTLLWTGLILPLVR